VACVDAQDQYKCEALMNRGTPSINGSRSPYKSWQAPGGLIHQYKSAEIARCAQRRTIVFAGDSAIRQVFWATAKKLNKVQARALERQARTHEDFNQTLAGVTLEFLSLVCLTPHNEHQPYAYPQESYGLSLALVVHPARQLVVGTTE
jgi:N-acetylneuraminate 9-O-acetyltransferase